MKLLKDFKEELFERLLSIHWRQWNALGASGHGDEEKKWIIDLEALLVSSINLARREKRLSQFIHNWERQNKEWINYSRMKHIVHYFMKQNTDKKIDFFSENIFTTNSEHLKKSVCADVVPKKRSLLQFTLRGIFGINARAETYLYLFFNKIGNSNEIARHIYFDQKIVYRILERWTEINFVHKQKKGYALKNYSLIDYTKGQSYYLDWVKIFVLLNMIIEVLNKDPWQNELYLLSSFFRDITEDAQEVGHYFNIEFPDPVLYKGTEFFEPFIESVLELLKKIG